MVISLPADHEGGQLAVRNAGNEVLFDWSNSANRKDSTPCIKWAAFYSDCEHEVLEVKSGHRITLTYNLYVTRGLGHLAGAAAALDATTLPLYKTLQTALKQSSFFGKGHVIAVWLTHAYAHTSKHNNFLPSSLKGADMSLYETALALGLHCKVVPVVTNGGYRNKFSPLETAEIYEGEDENWGLPMSRRLYTWINAKDKSPKEAQAAYVVVSISSDHSEISFADVDSSLAMSLENLTSSTLVLRCLSKFRRSMRGVLGWPLHPKASSREARLA